MSVVATVAAGIQGALLLARGRPDGVQLVENDRTAAIRSFWAIPLCLPPVVCMRLLDWVQTGLPPSVPLSLGRYLLVFVVGWLLYVCVSHPLARQLGRGDDWPRFIAVWSYCSVIENTLVALGALPGALGVPPVIDQACQVITIGWALWLEWYAIGLSLRVSGWAAAGLLAVDVGIGIMLAGFG